MYHISTDTQETGVNVDSEAIDLSQKCQFVWAGIDVNCSEGQTRFFQAYVGCEAVKIMLVSVGLG